MQNLCALVLVQHHILRARFHVRLLFCLASCCSWRLLLLSSSILVTYLNVSPCFFGGLASTIFCIIAQTISLGCPLMICMKSAHSSSFIHCLLYRGSISPSLSLQASFHASPSAISALTLSSVMSVLMLSIMPYVLSTVEQLVRSFRTSYGRLWFITFAVSRKSKASTSPAFPCCPCLRHWVRSEERHISLLRRSKFDSLLSSLQLYECPHHPQNPFLFALPLAPSHTNHVKKHWQWSHEQVRGNRYLGDQRISL